MDQRRLSNGFVPNSLVILSVESVGMSWKDWPYQFFLTGQPFTISLAIAYTGCGDAWQEHLSFMFILILLWSGIYSGSWTSTQVTNVFPSNLSLGGIQEGYSNCILGGIRGKQGFNGEKLDISLGCH